MGTYVPNTLEQQEAMLAAVGAKSFQDFYAGVPQAMLVESLRLPEGLSELEVRQKVSAMAFSGPASENMAYF